MLNHGRNKTRYTASLEGNSKSMELTLKSLMFKTHITSHRVALFKINIVATAT